MMIIRIVWIAGCSDIVIQPEPTEFTAGIL